MECEDTFTNDTHKLPSLICHQAGVTLITDVEHICYKQFRQNYQVVIFP